MDIWVVIWSAVVFETVLKSSISSSMYCLRQRLRLYHVNNLSRVALRLCDELQVWFHLQSGMGMISVMCIFSYVLASTTQVRALGLVELSKIARFSSIQKITFNNCNLQVNSRENWLFITKHPKATGHSDNLYRNEQAEQLHTATGTGRREHVDVFLCAPIKSLIFFLSFYVMSLNNLLLSNFKRKLHRRDSSESSSGSPVEKRLKELFE